MALAARWTTGPGPRRARSAFAVQRQEVLGHCGSKSPRAGEFARPSRTCTTLRERDQPGPVGRLADPGAGLASGRPGPTHPDGVHGRQRGASARRCCAPGPHSACPAPPAPPSAARRDIPRRSARRPSRTGRSARSSSPSIGGDVARLPRRRHTTRCTVSAMSVAPPRNHRLQPPPRQPRNPSRSTSTPSFADHAATRREELRLRSIAPAVPARSVDRTAAEPSGARLIPLSGSRYPAAPQHSSFPRLQPLLLGNTLNLKHLPPHVTSLPDRS